MLGVILPFAGGFAAAELAGGDLSLAIFLAAALTAMLQDAIFARASWLAEEGNEDVATRFLRASSEASR